MGGKNHSTVILACRRIEQLMTADASVQWGSPSGPRSKNINVIVEDIEAQAGNGLLREASMPASVVPRKAAAAEGDKVASQGAKPSAVLGAA